jgi:hypothetical protein
MDTLIEIAKNVLKEFEVGIDERGIVSFPNLIKYPIKIEDVKIVHDWIGEKKDLGDSRSSYGIRNEIQYSSKPISNGALIVTAIGLKNEFILNRFNLEVTFPNRLLICPKRLNKNVHVNNILNQENIMIRKMSKYEENKMVEFITQEWKTKKFGFYGNLGTILMPSQLLFGIFIKSELIGFIVFKSETDLSPCYFEIFSPFRNNKHASNCIKFIHNEMSGNLSIIEVIPEATLFWEKMGYRKLSPDSSWMSKIC